SKKIRQGQVGCRTRQKKLRWLEVDISVGVARRWWLYFRSLARLPLYFCWDRLGLCLCCPGEIQRKKCVWTGR
ncbi:hypothetical protein CORC01_04159, partial [Colletotrichum orchidophilum]